MAIPGFRAVRERTRVSVFTNDFRAVKEAINRYSLEEGEYPTESGVLVPEFSDYIRDDIINNATVIGGNWTFDDASHLFALGVSGYEVDDDLIAEIDKAVDDGDTSTGKMTITAANEFYFVIED